MVVGSVDVLVILMLMFGVNLKVKLLVSSFVYVSGIFGDLMDLVSVQGLIFMVVDSDVDVVGLMVIVISSNFSVGVVIFSGSGKICFFKISFWQIGYVDIIVIVVDGDCVFVSYVVYYVVSQVVGIMFSICFFSGVSNVLSVQEVGDGYMVVVDDEFNVLSFYFQVMFSVLVVQFDFSFLMNLIDIVNFEMDLEVSVWLGNWIFWMGL